MQPQVITKPNATMFDTVSAMRSLAQQGKRDLNVRRLAEQITMGVAQGDYSSEVLAIYYWVCRNIRYLRDIDGVEFLQQPRHVIAHRQGDCDDMATLLAALLMTAGNPVQFATAGFAGGAPNYSHVYVEVITPHGTIALDPVANRDTVEMLGRVKHRKTFPVSQGGMTGNGIGQLRHMSSDGGTLYSVWDYHRGTYDYYEGPATKIPATGRYRKPTLRMLAGSPPEAIAAALPAGAKKVGSGEAAKGIVATSKAIGSISLPSANTMMKLAAGAAAGVVVYRWWTMR